MPEYQLELKQIVDYPRCRIYRQFVQTLIDDRSIRVSGGSGLFYFVVLCSYANFRTSYRRMDGISYTVYPGEWLCSLQELSKCFRTRFQHQALAVLEDLQDRHLITYSVLGHGRLVKFKIREWSKSNRVLDYNAPCQKDTGFFFFPVSVVAEIISSGRCSEMDAVLDLWLNTVYNDEQVQGSEIGPVVYLRNGTGSPLVSYADLATRWGVSKATAGRYLKKLNDMGYLSATPFPGTHGSAIYLQNYLSTMFQISDVMLDKEEIAMALNIKITLPDEPAAANTEQDSGSSLDFGVSKSHIQIIEQKVRKILAVQGIPCVECRQSKCMLLLLSDDCRDELLLRKSLGCLSERLFLFTLSCGAERELFRFELRLVPTSGRQKEVL
ncbi:MAG: helix-turn-helix domain-containing protein [Oscillospiraceae bacterium]|nr:helix-turn-helix domain-containing protein [Oscillospiraceae bacterium]